MPGMRVAVSYMLHRASGYTQMHVTKASIACALRHWGGRDEGIRGPDPTTIASGRVRQLTTHRAAGDGTSRQFQQAEEKAPHRRFVGLIYNVQYTVY